MMTNEISDPSRSFPGRGRAPSASSKVVVHVQRTDEPLVCTARVHQRLTTLDLAIYTDLGTSRAP